jgi:hypothetical protein
VASNNLPDLGGNDPALPGTYGYDGEEPEPVPAWRKPIALVGWALLIAVLIGLIIYGIIALMQGPEPTPTTTTTRTTTATTTPTTPTTTTTPDTGASSAPTTPTTARRKHATDRLGAVVGDHR